MDTLKLANTIRKDVLRMTNLGSSGHIGSVFSIADILAVLYGEVLSYDVKNPTWEDRDRFILSKGHAGAGIYAALARSGFFDVAKLDTHYKDGSDLSGHVSHKGIPGVEFSTGALGHGLSVGVGMALDAKRKKKDHKVFVIVGDGECDEGSIWEAALFSPHHNLNNLVVIVDYNKIQSLNTVENVLSLEPFSDKWKSFGWDTRVVDGHDHESLRVALTTPSSSPIAIIANTVKGKGVSFMENTILWHYRTAKGEEYDAAIKELEESV
ncbi:MAG: transketolase [Candidatus Magasanikbacteria bacterium]|jgi:transketolase|nr:transketolase [Candidatus Magasanikbacteria bacterium]MBT4221237.1 transketolase [Candidatus Magasanikbacteria bacterium]MBT4350666.1 transketolase [Candidatus Magasanikbacteria bacterium]MBT4541334.1 transketolase [Candidatus Magasanikbacteria bacterium]MBT6253068.1 transketolase [Candidatus Magasanikbacteria bacterium]